MNILILINNAPEYIRHFKNVGEVFKKNGNQVIYACESHWPEIEYDVSLADELRYYFTDFSNSKKAIMNCDIDYNLRTFFYSCFDRNHHYNINHLSNKTSDLIITNLLEFFDYIFEKEKIDLVLYENVSNSFSYAAYHVSKLKTKRYFGLITSRIPNRLEIWEDEYGNIEKRRGLFESLLALKEYKANLQIEEYLRDINGSIVKPDYMTKNPTNLNINYFHYYFKKIRLCGKFIEFYLNYYNEVREAYQSAHPIVTSLKSIKRSFLRKYKISLLKKMFDSFDFVNETYFLLPLHFQPESSTSVNAMYYDNQYEFIKNTAFSLPIGTTLYVKDHPNGIGFLSMDFYKRLKRIPNVKYINPLVQTKELIQNSQGIITLTSTMGYEALLMNKPVITLGKVFYNYHPYCFNINSYNDIYPTIKKILAHDFQNFDSFNLKFLEVYFKDTYEGKVLNDYANPENIYSHILNRFYEKTN